MKRYAVRMEESEKRGERSKVVVVVVVDERICKLSECTPLANCSFPDVEKSRKSWNISFVTRDFSALPFVSLVHRMSRMLNNYKGMRLVAVPKFLLRVLYEPAYFSFPRKFFQSSFFISFKSKINLIDIDIIFRII